MTGVDHDAARTAKLQATIDGTAASGIQAHVENHQHPVPAINSISTPALKPGKRECGTGSISGSASRPWRIEASRPSTGSSTRASSNPGRGRLAALSAKACLGLRWAPRMAAANAVRAILSDWHPFVTVSSRDKRSRYPLFFPCRQIRVTPPLESVHGLYCQPLLDIGDLLLYGSSTAVVHYWHRVPGAAGGF